MGERVVLNSPADFKSKIADLNRRIADIDERLSEMYREGAGSTLIKIKATERLERQTKKSLSMLQRKLMDLKDEKADRRVLLNIQKSVRELDRELKNIKEVKTELERGIRETRAARNELESKMKVFQRDIRTEAGDFKVLNKKFRRSMDELERKIRKLERLPKELDEQLEKQEYNFREKIEFINSAISTLNKKLFDAASDFDKKFARKEEMSGIERDIDELKECISSLSKSLRITKSLAEEVKENKNRIEKANSTLKSLGNWGSTIEESVNTALKGIGKNHDIISRFSSEIEDLKLVDNTREIKLIRREVKELEDKLSKISFPDYSADIDGIRKKIREIEGTVSSIHDYSEDIQDLRKKIRELESTVSSISIPNHSHKINNIEGKIQDIEKSVKETDISNVGEMVSRWYERIKAEEESRRAVLQKEIMQNRQMVNELQNRLVGRDSEMAKAGEGIRKIERVIESIERNLIGHDDIRKLRNIINTDIEEIRNRLAEERGKRAEIESKLREIEEIRPETDTSRMDELERRIDKVEEEVPELPEDIVKKPEIEDLEVRMSNKLNEEFARSIDEKIETERRKLEQQVVNLKQWANDINARINAQDFSSEIAPVIKSMEELRNNIQNELASLKQGLSMVESRNQVMFSEIKKVSESQDRTEERKIMDSLQNRIKELEQEKERLQEMISETRGKMVQKPDMGSISSFIEDKVKEIEGKMPKDFVSKKEMDTALLELANSISQSNQLEDMEKRLNAMEKSMKELSTMSTAIDSLHSTVNSMGKHLAEMPKNLTFGDELQVIRSGLSQLDSIQQHIMHIQQEIAAIKAQMAQSDAHFRIDNVEEQLEDLKRNRGKEPMGDIIKALDDKLYRMQKRLSYEQGE